VAALVQQGINIDYCATVQHNNTKKDVDAAIEEVTCIITSFTFYYTILLADNANTFGLTVQHRCRHTRRRNWSRVGRLKKSLDFPIRGYSL